MTATCRIAPRNLWDELTLSTQLTPETGYSIDNTKDDQRSRVWRTTDDADQHVSGTCDDGLPRTANMVSFYGHRNHGGSVEWCFYSDAAYSTLAYTTGVVDITQLETVSGFDWGDGTVDPFLANTAFRLTIPSTTFLSCRAYFSAYASPFGYDRWQVCRFSLANEYELPYTAIYGHTLGIVDQTDRNRSRGGSLRTNVGPNWRTVALDIKRVPDDDLGTWMDIMRYCGTGRSFPFTLYADAGTRLAREHHFLAKFSSLDALNRWHSQYTSKRIQIEEV